MGGSEAVLELESTKALAATLSDCVDTDPWAELVLFWQTSDLIQVIFHSGTWAHTAESTFWCLTHSSSRAFYMHMAFWKSSLVHPNDSPKARFHHSVKTTRPNCFRSAGNMFVTGKATVVAMGAWIYKLITVDNIPKSTVMLEWMAFPNCAGIHTFFCAHNF